MVDDLFTCALCEQTFRKDWSDEEAREEAVATWGEEMLLAGTYVVCDDCYPFAKEATQKAIEEMNNGND